MSHHLLIRPGAHACVQGNEINETHDVFIGGTTLIGNSTCIGTAPAKAYPDQSKRICDVVQDQAIMGPPGTVTVISYDKNGILFFQPVRFVGKYFKADDQLAINGHTFIKANRVDIDGNIIYPKDSAIDVSGNHYSGYSVRQVDPNYSPR